MPFPVTSRIWMPATVGAIAASLSVVLSVLPSPWGTICALALASGLTVMFLRQYRDCVLARDSYEKQRQHLQHRLNQRDRYQLSPGYRASLDGVVIDASPSFRQLLPLGVPIQVWDCFERPEQWAEISRELATHDQVELEIHIRQGRLSVPTRQRFWALRDATGGIVEIEASVLDLTTESDQSAQLDRLQTMLAQAGRELEHKNEQIQDHCKTIAQLRQQMAQGRRDSLEFLAAISRQTRRPVTSLLQLAGAVGERSPAAIAETTASARHLLAWLDNISEFASLETTRTPAIREPFSLRQVLDQSIRRVALAAENKNIDLSLAISPATPDLVLGDGPHIEQVLTGLLENSVSCCDSGVISLRVSGQPAEAPQPRVVFRLDVSGPGLPPAVIECAGNPLSGKPNRTESEIGLGLAIARQLAQRMNGTLDLQNEPGNGTQVVLSLPLAVQQHDAATRADLTPLQGIAVLIVEPRTQARDALVETLENWQMRVATAPHSEAALEQLRCAVSEQQPFRILLIDSATPPNGGLALAEIVLDDLAFQAVRPILVLPHSHRHWQNEPLLPGLRASISKPLSERELATALLDCLREDTLPEATAPSRRILIAEDDAVNRRIAVRLVQRMGFEVDSVPNGEEAVAALQMRPYGLVLMDCMMPVMDGFRATALIRQSPGSSRNVPIIALTASALAGDRRRCLDAGMNDYISKPFTYEDLRASLERWIDARTPAESTTSTSRTEA